MSDKWDGWTDEQPVNKKEELLHFYYCSNIFSLQEIDVMWEGELRKFYRLSIGNLWGSQSIWLATLRDSVKATDRMCKLQAKNEEREEAGKNRKSIDPEKLEGFVYTEPRPKQEAVA